jgi:hypothetical protein
MTEEQPVQSERSDLVRPAGWALARVAPLLVLVLVAGLVALRASGLGLLLEVARLSRTELASDEDVLRSEPVLGPESPILARLRRDYAPGTPIALPLTSASVTRGQRFWLALLPEYPIASNAELVICPLPCAESGLVLVQRGAEFGLMRRSPSGRESIRE